MRLAALSQLWLALAAVPAVPVVRW